jgi:hypothetical protein
MRHKSALIIKVSLTDRVEKISVEYHVLQRP